MKFLDRLPYLIATGVMLALCCPVVAACTVGTTPVAFGSIDPVAAMPTDSSGTVVVSCPAESNYTVTIDGGTGTVDNRHMANGANQLQYQLYTDANLTLIWGDGTAGTVTVTGTAGPGADATHTVYGRVPAQPLARVGAYADTLIVTVTF